MGLFAKTKKNTGWMAISFQDDGIGTAYVRRSATGAPVVERISFHASDKSASAQPLEKLAKEFQAARYHCTSLLAENEYQLLSVDAPNVPPDELKTAIRWRLKDMLDFHVDDATIDVLDVPVGKDAAAKTHTMYAVAARNQVIAQRQALFEQTKIPLSVIDIPEMAQRNISALLEPSGRGVAVLSFDASGGLLTITYNGELYLARRIDVSLEQVTRSSPEHHNALYDRVALEVQRSLDHFDRQYRHITLSKLVLSPLGEEGLDLQDYLASNMHLPVEILDLASLLDISRVPELKRVADQQRYFFTVGAALREEAIAL
jgi:MSHA biogenesis protein MshI